MILILVKCIYLFLFFIFGIKAVPILTDISDIHNSTLNRSQNSVLSKYHLNTSSNVSLMLPKFQIPKNFNLTKIAKDLKDFGIDNLDDDKHMEGLPLDRHGKVNLEFHKELFLGNHELFESYIQYDEEKRNKKLEEIFNEADVDHNGRLSKDELTNYAFKNVRQHLKEAKDKNAQLFILIDTDQNGKITWAEYIALYIKFHNASTSDIRDSDDVNFIPGSLNLDLQREVLKIRYRWKQADNSDDNELNMDEFLAFRHPEIASRSSTYIANDIILQMDRDNDQKINETEFVFMPSRASADEHKEWAEMDKQWLAAQKKEFRELDENGDGILTKDELVKAYDPMNRVHIDIQIKRLFSQVDDSPTDNSLSLKEIQKHADIFTDMRMFDADRVLHDEM